jgi:putative DNA primase/helicase
LALEIKAREMVIAPWLPEKGLAMIYAPRGIGKTHLGLSAAYVIAAGKGFLGWQAPKPRRVLYIDGEMPEVTLQERLRAIESRFRAELPDPDYLRLLSADRTEGGLPDLCTDEGQGEIDAAIGTETEVIFVDHLSALARSARENEGDDWVPLQGWALAHRRDGRAVVMIHHAGKGGAQRGTSRREDVLDTVMSLKRPDDYSPEQGARFIVEFDKARGIWGENALPFLATYEERDGAAVWTHTVLRDVELKRVVELTREGKSLRDIEEATDGRISKSKAGRLLQQAKDRRMLEGPAAVA